MPLLGKVLQLPVKAVPWLPLEHGAGLQALSALPILDPFRWLIPEGSAPDPAAAARSYDELCTCARRLLSGRVEREEARSLEKRLATIKDAPTLLSLAAACYALRAESAAGGGAAPGGAAARGAAAQGESILGSAFSRLRTDAMARLCGYVMRGCDGDGAAYHLVRQRSARIHSARLAYGRRALVK